MNIIKNMAATSLILTFFVAPLYVNANSVDGTIYSTKLNETKYNDTDHGTVTEIMITVINFILSIIGGLAVVILVIAGLMYILSGGDEGKVETAKNWITYAIIGLIIALLGYVIVRIVSNVIVTS